MSRFVDLTHRVQERVRESMTQNENQVFMGIALFMGALIGLVVAGFIVATEGLQSLLFPEDVERWRRLVTPILGTITAGYLLSYFFPEARGSGVPQTKAAMFARQGLIPMRTVFGKFLCSWITLGSGIALGREGPSVQIGAGLSSSLGRALGLTAERIQMLVPIGAAAALAAAFNTPLAAILFALEEIIGNLHAPILGSAVVSVFTSLFVMRLLLGNEPLFHVPEYQAVHPAEFIVYALLGVIGGLVSVAFVKLMLRMRERFLRMPRASRWIQPAVGGLVVGMMAYALPTIAHFGYPKAGEALNGQLPFSQMVLLVVLGVLATAISYATGNAGGIFGPSLFIGSMVGGSVGSLVHGYFPDLTAGSGAYALVGMGTAFAGILRVPMVSVIMIFELTHDYAIIVPLMISNLISFFVSYRLQETPIYEALALQEGIHLPTSESSKRHLQVRLAMRPPRETFDTEMTVSECLERAGHSSMRAWPVTDKKGIWGLISLGELEEAAAEDRNGVKVGALIDTRPFPHLHADHSLDLALERMGKSGYDLLPVVSRGNIHEMEAVCSLMDVLRAFGVHGAQPGAPPDANDMGTA